MPLPLGFRWQLYAWLVDVRQEAKPREQEESRSLCASNRQIGDQSCHKGLEVLAASSDNHWPASAKCRARLPPLTAKSPARAILPTTEDEGDVNSISQRICLSQCY